MSDRPTPKQLAEWRRLAELVTKNGLDARYLDANGCMRWEAAPLIEAVPALLDENERLREALRQICELRRWGSMVGVARRALGEEPR